MADVCLREKPSMNGNNGRETDLRVKGNVAVESRLNFD